MLILPLDCVRLVYGSSPAVFDSSQTFAMTAVWLLQCEVEGRAALIAGSTFRLQLLIDNICKICEGLHLPNLTLPAISNGA